MNGKSFGKLGSVFFSYEVECVMISPHSPIHFKVFLLAILMKCITSAGNNEEKVATLRIPQHIVLLSTRIGLFTHHALIVSK